MHQFPPLPIEPPKVRIYRTTLRIKLTNVRIKLTDVRIKLTKLRISKVGSKDNKGREIDDFNGTRMTRIELIIRPHLC